jgi:hypothetical protein
MEDNAGSEIDYYHNHGCGFRITRWAKVFVKFSSHAASKFPDGLFRRDLPGGEWRDAGVLGYCLLCKPTRHKRRCDSMFKLPAPDSKTNMEAKQTKSCGWFQVEDMR